MVYGIRKVPESCGFAMAGLSVAMSLGRAGGVRDFDITHQHRPHPNGRACECRLARAGVLGKDTACAARLSVADLMVQAGTGPALRRCRLTSLT
jgi:hypothetical protein